MAVPFTKNAKLMRAIRDNDTPRALHWLENGADPNTHAYNFYALTMAFVNRNEDIIIALLEKGADYTRTMTGTLPIHFYTSPFMPKVLDYLLTHGSDIDEADSARRTSLHDAVIAGKLDVITFLLGRGASPDRQDISGMTPRDYAEKTQNRSMIAAFPQVLALPAPDTAKIPSTLTDHWTVQAPELATHITQLEGAGQKITDAFNFSARERITTVLDLEHKTQSVVIRSFDEIKDKTPLEQACDVLERNDIKIDRDTIHQAPRKKNSLTVSGK